MDALKRERKNDKDFYSNGIAQLISEMLLTHKSAFIYLFTYLFKVE